MSDSTVKSRKLAVAHLNEAVARLSHDDLPWTARVRYFKKALIAVVNVYLATPRVQHRPALRSEAAYRAEKGLPSSKVNRT